MSAVSFAALMQAAVDRLSTDVREAIAVAYTQPASGRTLGELIAEERAAAGLSLDQVAVRAGCTKSHVWELEQGRARNPTVAMCHGIAVALGMPFELVCHAALESQRRWEVL